MANRVGVSAERKARGVRGESGKTGGYERTSASPLLLLIGPLGMKTLRLANRSIAGSEGDPNRESFQPAFAGKTGLRWMRFTVGASLLAKVVNDKARLRGKRGMFGFFASKLAPTVLRQLQPTGRLVQGAQVFADLFEIGLAGGNFCSPRRLQQHPHLFIQIAGQRLQLLLAQGAF